MILLDEHNLSQKTFVKNVSKYNFTIMTRRGSKSMFISFLLTIVVPMAGHSMAGKMFLLREDNAVGCVASK